jgi:hypothetical protein
MAQGTSPELVEIANSVILIAFVTGMAVGALFTTIRYFRYRLYGLEAPELLVRDVVARVTLTLPFLAILIFRVLGVNPIDEWWGPAWYIGSGVLAVLGVWMYVYYELFIIER